MKYAAKIREEELKNKVAADWFGAFDATPIIGNIDFAVCFSTTRETKPPASYNREQNNSSAHEAGGFVSLETDFLLWAEAKAGVKDNLLAPLAQLVLTIGAARTHEKHLPPKFLAAFDAEKIAFIEFHKIADFFTQNDFNWNVAPNDHKTREFQQVLSRLSKQNGRDLIHFDWDTDAAELKKWIAANFRPGDTSRIRITKNNFTAVYAKWRAAVKPSIDINWDAMKAAAKQRGEISILDADFYLADLLSDKNKTLKEKLRVVLNHDHYELDRIIDEFGLFSSRRAEFTDHGDAHAQFWNRYERPPREEYWDYIIERRDLLVPQDVREVKGAFFTPSRWVELSQQYIADALGEDWQQEYYIWDCCAGTGNLLAGLTEKYRVFASTLDQADVAVMHDRIKNGANLLPSHVFQFDFLNDDLFGPKVPADLRAILADPEKRKKLVIYINPPYAEASTTRTKTGTGKNKPGTATENAMNLRYKPLIGKAANELFALFLIRIHKELQCCKLAQFAKLKALCAPNFAGFREVFRAKLLKMFAVPANTFDNVKGHFPIGFFIWDTSIEEEFKSIICDIFDKDGVQLPPKTLFPVTKDNIINKWLHTNFDVTGEEIAWLRFVPNDFQNNAGVYITNHPKQSDIDESRIAKITRSNVIPFAVYLAVRHAIEATWLNDRDQFLYPADSWAEDIDFQNDCLIYTLFHGQNRISASGNSDFSIHRFFDSSIGEGQILFSHSKNRLIEKSKNPLPPNHWIPFTESEVDAQSAFVSHFMSDFLRGKIARATTTTQGDLFSRDAPTARETKPPASSSSRETKPPASSSSRETKPPASYNSGRNNSSSYEAGGFVSLEAASSPCILSQLTPAARAVYDAGLALWRYYHTTAASHQAPSTRHQAPYLPNASFYDIRAHFQGFTNGKMNADSPDETYCVLIAALRAALKNLASQIEPRIYAHGFLRR